MLTVTNDHALLVAVYKSWRDRPTLETHDGFSAKINMDAGGGDKYVLDIKTAVKLQTEHGFCNCCSAVALCHTCTSHPTATMHGVKVCTNPDPNPDPVPIPIPNPNPNPNPKSTAWRNG